MWDDVQVDRFEEQRPQHLDLTFGRAQYPGYLQ